MVGLLDVIHRSPSWKPQPKCGCTRFPAFACVYFFREGQKAQRFDWYSTDGVLPKSSNKTESAWCFLRYAIGTLKMFGFVMTMFFLSWKCQKGSAQKLSAWDSPWLWWVVMSDNWGLGICLSEVQLQYRFFNTIFHQPHNLIAERRGKITKETIPLQETPKNVTRYVHVIYDVMFHSFHTPKWQVAPFIAMTCEIPMAG